MKYILVLTLSIAAASAADPDFNTGQAARALIGQIQFTSQDSGASSVLVGGVSGVAYGNDTLFVADSNRVGSSPINNRVLIFKNVSSIVPAPTAVLNYDRPCPVCTGEATVVLGQPDFVSTDYHLAPDGMRTPTAVATDGNILVVADTDNNRVLIWKSIPSSNGQPADVVVGQPDMKTSKIPPGNVPNAKSMRGPQGVWIQYGKLYVADTQNHRVLIYNSIPSSNGVAADVVLGQPNFTTFVEPDIAQAKVDAQPNNMLNPVSVTSDGQRLYVTDLGHNRVLIWNSIPTANQTPADVVIGQPDMTSSLSNNSFSTDTNSIESKVLCDSNGQDAKGNPTYPDRCNATLSFPRFALSDGHRVFIADGGNDRVLIYNHVPTGNGEAADYVIGQLGGQINQASDATDSLRTPMSMAWDGTNLYVGDAYNRRVMIYSPAQQNVPFTGVRNAASREIFAVGSVTFAGSITAGDSVTLKIGDNSYTYKVVKDDTFDSIIKAFVTQINSANSGAGDPNVVAIANTATAAIVLTARQSGPAGNDVAYSTSLSTSATITATTGGSTLNGGYDAAKIGPGTVVSVLGDHLADSTVSADPSRDDLPLDLGGVQVYFNGVRAPLLMVSPTQVNAQIPFEFLDTTSINAYVRTQHADGSVTVSTPVAVPIVPQNPGIFAEKGEDPRPGIVMHGSSKATGTVSVDGTAKTGDTATVSIEDRSYTYTVQDGDSLESIRDALIALIDQDPKVHAYPAGVFTRIRLQARLDGPDGDGIPYSASAASGAQVILTATGSALCCANVAYSRVTDDNPAVPGETIIVYATGLGLPTPADGVNTGFKYSGPDDQPTEFVSSLAGGKTANVLLAELKKGMVGTWEVHLELNSDIPTNPATQLTIAQDVYVSNIVTFQVVNPNPPASP